MRRIEIYDTTLRDGLQSPGVAVDGQGRLAIARRLALLGVDAIEAGFPVVGEAEAEAVRLVAREVDGPVIKGLARAHPRDVDAAWDAVRDAARPRITVYAPVSDVQIAHVLRGTREDALGRIRAAVAHAHTLAGDVEFSPMDATRADPAFLAETVAVAIAEGAAIVSVPDTVGYTVPHEFAALLTRLQADVTQLAQVTLAVHCHNDLGLAVANSLAGVLAGATAVEGTINGLGARAGNAALEELVMLIDTRGAHLGLETAIAPEHLTAASRLVSELTGYTVQPNKAIVGANAFQHDAALYRAAVGRDRATYEIMDPRRVGRDDA
ncbi:unannotated protein [freshwater metagenome]|uniref:2-isopropylmalate synthase n=1 Tax=freshwater metagenome TaxID=449393 RepID=A0A6J7HNU3_9ZZZZ|nr:hypothetical protein [Actinomycetota bacterium]